MASSGAPFSDSVQPAVIEPAVSSRKNHGIIAASMALVVFGFLTYSLTQIAVKVTEKSQYPGPHRQVVQITVLPGGKLLKVLDRDVIEYVNLRYAHIKQRFRHAELAFPGASIADNTRNLTSCARAGYVPFPSYPFLKTAGYEDCLFLNIWTPFDEEDEAPKAVVVVLVGGNFASGGSGDHEFFNGSAMASLWNQVVVVPNYRVGILGFMNVPSENGTQDAGISDQVLALQWVEKNIGLYGGSPSHVTLLGHEAGATAVGYHLFSVESMNLFHRAILISGSPTRVLPQDAQFTIRDISHDLLCSDTDYQDGNEIARCLRTKSVQSLIANQQTATLNGAVATFCPLFAENLTERYLFENSKIPLLLKDRREILVGTVEDEGSAYASALLGFFGINNETDLDADTAAMMLRDMLRLHDVKDYERLVALYLRDSHASPIKALESALGDFVVHCPVENFVRRFSDGGNDVFVYHFTYAPDYQWWPQWMRVPQMIDWLYLSGNIQHIKDGVHVSAQDVKLSQDMSNLLSCFARTGNPERCPSAPIVHWDKWTKEGRDYLLIDNDTSMVTRHGLPSAKVCENWQRMFADGAMHHSLVVDKVNAVAAARPINASDARVQMVKSTLHKGEPIREKPRPKLAVELLSGEDNGRRGRRPVAPSWTQYLSELVQKHHLQKVNWSSLTVEA